MLSKDQIRDTLRTISTNNNLYGEVAELLVQELTYALYHNQVEVLNAIQESNLSTAKLLNSKIRNCMSVMYPVYRGRNVRVLLSFIPIERVEFKKFDVLYSSNNFKVYASESFSYAPSLTGLEVGRSITGIISSDDLYESSVEITDNNKYYVDFKINRLMVSNISEDIQVLIDDVEYPITRDFYYHVNQTNTGVDSIGSSTPLLSQNLDSLFVLTLPDYGIRIFKKGYFTPSTKVKIRALKYTTYDDLNASEFNKIQLANTIQIQSANKLDYNNVISPDIITNTTGFYNTAVMEIERDNEKSLLYSANYYARIQQPMTTKADVDILFQEYFIDQVRYAKSHAQGNTIYIFYIRKSGYPITTAGFNDFVNRHKSYFINTNLKCIESIKIDVLVEMTLYVKSSIDLSSDINAIYDKYAYILSDPSKFDSPTYEVLNKRLIEAEIAKLPTVEYIEELNYSPDILSEYEVRDGVKIPTYLVFHVNINYKSNYENISQSAH